MPSAALRARLGGAGGGQAGDRREEVRLDLEGCGRIAVTANQAGYAEHFMHIRLEIAQHQPAAVRPHLAQQAKQGTKAGAGQVGNRLKINNDMPSLDHAPGRQNLLAKSIREGIADELRGLDAKDQHRTANVFEGKLFRHEAPWARRIRTLF